MMFFFSALIFKGNAVRFVFIMGILFIKCVCVCVCVCVRVRVCVFGVGGGGGGGGANTFR